MDHTALISRVQRNCDISDARHAGLYSVCGLALRLRDLYKWDQGLAPWTEGVPAAVLEWIDARETRWSALEAEDYLPVPVNGRTFDPFDTPAVNDALAPSGLFYGAGYAYSLKPSFFLSEIVSIERVNGAPMIQLGTELARDLLTIPAMTQDGQIVLRRESARMYLWDQIMYLKPSGRPALDRALQAFGKGGTDTEHLRRHLDDLLERVQELYVYHELGEIRDEMFDRDIWRALIAEFPHSPVELLVRSVKDLLADTGADGTLRRILHKRDPVSLGMFVAFFDGLGRDLFPELRVAYSLFASSDDWSVIEEAVDTGHAVAARCARDICDVYRSGDTGSGKEAMADAIRALIPCTGSTAAAAGHADDAPVDGPSKSE